MTRRDHEGLSCAQNRPIAYLNFIHLPIIFPTNFAWPRARRQIID